MLIGRMRQLINLDANNRAGLVRPARLPEISKFQRSDV